jgi:arsenite methyltransferase
VIPAVRDDAVRVYESPTLREALGHILHPGGLALTDEAMAACSLPSGARVLDVGCGAGATVAHLRARYGLAALGVDASDVLLASGRSREPALPLILARGELLPIGDGLMDAVLAECSLSVMADAGAALAEFRRILVPGGRLILADVYRRSTNGPELPQDSSMAPCLYGAPTRAQITKKLVEHGFEIAIWQDRSDALKYLAARLILAGGSPAQLWGGVCGDAAGTAARLKLGYYWLVAGKVPP